MRRVVPRNDTKRHGTIRQSKGGIGDCVEKGVKKMSELCDSIRKSKSRLNQLELANGAGPLSGPRDGIVIQPTAQGEEKTKVVDRECPFHRESPFQSEISTVYGKNDC
jgi:hypothetical protein